MPFPKLLRRIAWFAFVPSIVMWAVAMLGTGQPPSELTMFCIKYWWITFVLGASLFVALRSVAWAMQRAGFA